MSVTNEINKRKVGSHRSQRLLIGGLVIVTAAVCICAPFLLFPPMKMAVISKATVMAAGGWTYRISEPIVISEYPRIVVQSGRISVPEDIKDKAVSGSKFLAKLASGSVPLLLDNALVEVTLSTRDPQNKDIDAGDRDTDPIGAIAPVLAALHSVEFSDLRVKDATIVMMAGNSQPTRFHNVDGRLLRKAGKVAARGELGYRNNTVKYDIDAERPTEVKGVAKSSFKAIVSNELVSTSVTGVASFGDKVHITSSNMDLRVPNVGLFAKWLGAAWPQNHGVRSLAVSGAMDWVDGKLAFPNSKFIIDSNVAMGTMSVSRNDEVTFVDGTLAFDKLDAEPYLVSDEFNLSERDLSSASGWLEALSGQHRNKGLLGELNQIHADLRLSASKVYAGNFKATDVAATINLNSGKVLADIASMQLASGGQGTVQLSIDSQQPKAKCHLLAKLDNMDLAVASKILFGSTVISGAGHVTANLSGYGLEREELLSSMSGKLKISTPATVGLKIDLAKLMSEMKAGADQIDAVRGAERGWSEPWVGLTEVSNLKARLDVEDGQIVFADTTARTGTNAMLLSGQADLERRLVDLKMFIGERTAKQGGTLTNATAITELDASTGTATTATDNPDGIATGDIIRFEGNWNAPSVSIKAIKAADRSPGRLDATSGITGSSRPRSMPASIE